MTADLDPHGLPAKHLHVRLNAWEHEQLQRLAQSRCDGLQRTVRMILRAHLFADCD